MPERAAHPGEREAVETRVTRKVKSAIDDPTSVNAKQVYSRGILHAKVRVVVTSLEKMRIGQKIWTRYDVRRLILLWQNETLLKLLRIESRP